MIEKYVYECVKKHIGGEKFFDALDDFIRNDRAVFGVLKTLADNISDKRVNIIVSGKFGVAWNEYHSSFIVNGNLIPDDNYVDPMFDKPFKEWDNAIPGVWVFVDDSYFLGRTAKKVQDFVERNGGEFVGVVVAYDGSKEKKRWDLKCLYRYYDNIKEAVLLCED